MTSDIERPPRPLLVDEAKPAVPEIVDSSTSVFQEAVAHIPPFEYYGTVVADPFFASEIAFELAKFDQPAARNLLRLVKEGVLRFPPERTRARSLRKIASVELEYDWPEAEETLELALDTDVPPWKADAHYIATIEGVASQSGDKARDLLRRRFPRWQLSDLQLNIVKEEQERDPQKAAKVVNKYLLDDDAWNRMGLHEMDGGRQRDPESQVYIAQSFGRLVARFGDMDLAEKMADVLHPENPLRFVILAEVAAREPKSRRGRKCLREARRLLGKENASHASLDPFTEKGIVFEPEDWQRLADAFESVDSELSVQFREMYDKVDIFGVGVSRAEARKTLLSGPAPAASRIIRKVIEADNAMGVVTAIPRGPRAELEKMLVEIAAANPTRVVSLVDDNFIAGEGRGEWEVSELKVDILIKGAEALREANHIGEARDLLGRALVIARSVLGEEKVVARPRTGRDLIKRAPSNFMLGLKVIALSKVAAALARTGL